MLSSPLSRLLFILVVSSFVNDRPGIDFFKRLGTPSPLQFDVCKSQRRRSRSPETFSSDHILNGKTRHGTVDEER